jgi:hypothetical protein
MTHTRRLRFLDFSVKTFDVIAAGDDLEIIHDHDGVSRKHPRGVLDGTGIHGTSIHAVQLLNLDVVLWREQDMTARHSRAFGPKMV